MVGLSLCANVMGFVFLAHAQTPTGDTPDAVCGPRCVQRVLEFYQQSTNLLGLVQEVQWPNIGAGTSLEELQKALTRRGIHGELFLIPKTATLEWRYPVIVHVGSDNLLGHFMLCRTDRDGQLQIANAAFAQDQERLLSAWGKRTGAILVTSPTPIDRADVVKSIRQPSDWVSLSAMLGAMLLSLYGLAATVGRGHLV